MPHPLRSPFRILFICVENSCRSQMAEAFACLHGRDKVEAYSAGSRPSGQVNPRAIASMRERGYDLDKHFSKGLDDLPEVEFDLAITMGCGDRCPAIRARARQDWEIPDPKNMAPEGFREIRDLIEKKVQDLLAEL